MKQLLLLPFLMMLQASVAQERSSDSLIKSTLLQGIWEVDSSAFVDNGIIGDYTVPLAPVQWHFLKNNDYSLVNNGYGNSGTFRLVDRSIFVSLFGMESEYVILEIDERSLRLRSMVYSTTDKTLETVSYLSQKNR